MPIGLHLEPQQRVYAGFALHALTMGSIFPRMPDIMAAMGVAEGALGLGLIGAPVGTFLALTLATPALERIGFRRTLLSVSSLVALFYAIAVHASGPLALFLLLIPVGIGIGSAEIVLNLEADRTEALIGRRIMNRAHSFWSFGFFGAGLFGAWMAHIGISPGLHLGLIVGVAVIAAAVFLGRFERSDLAATIYGASTHYGIMTMVIDESPVLDHLRSVLGETVFDDYVAAGAAMEPGDAVRYARQQIQLAQTELVGAP